MEGLSEAEVTTRKIQLDTKGFCVFCLKRGEKALQVLPKDIESKDSDVEVDEVTEKELEEAAKLRQQFSKVLPKYLETTFEFLTDDKDNSDSSQEPEFLNKHFKVAPDVEVSFMCKDCSFLVERICQLFHAMKKIEMELDWKARQLRNIMAFAKRAPTRIKVFRQQFKDSGTGQDLETLNRIEKFRKEVLDKTSKKFRKTQPRIVFKRKGPLLSRISDKSSKKVPPANVTLNDAETQTELIDNTISSAAKRSNYLPTINQDPSSGKYNTRKNSSKTSNPKSSLDEGETSDIDWVPSAPASLVNSGSDEEDESRGLIRVRKLESLLSPTKSSSPVKSKRTTRASTRQSITSAGEVEPESLNQNDSPSVPTNPLPKTVQKSLSNIFSSSSLPNQTVKIIDNSSRKATLSEWLQSTFNCDKCNKMFISQATLSVHKMTCKLEVEEEESPPTPSQAEDLEADENDIDDPGESLMDGDGDTNHAEDSSNDEGTPPGQTEDNPIDISEDTDDAAAGNYLTNSSSAEETITSTTRTIRILRKESSPIPPPPKPKPVHVSGSRYCKYCAVSLSVNHFTRHRQTLKHKFNKRTHKKAKKLGQLTNGTSGSVQATVEKAEQNATHKNAVVTTEKSLEDNAVAATTSSTPTAIVTVSRDENNVQVVKILYLNKNGTSTTEQDNRGNENPEEPATIEIEAICNDAPDAVQVVPTSLQATAGEMDVIDISDD